MTDGSEIPRETFTLSVVVGRAIYRVSTLFSGLMLVLRTNNHQILAILKDTGLQQSLVVVLG
jgi:hypothetical protein